MALVDAKSESKTYQNNKTSIQNLLEKYINLADS